MSKPTKPPSEESLTALLEKHACPVRFHEVRTRFLGNIATPDPEASPLQALHALWGGELPVFDSMDEANALIAALVHGLWNDLARHQRRNQPFRLTRVPMEPTNASLAQVSQVRREELDGFIEGLFNSHEAIDLPERAHRAVGYLREIRGMMAGLYDLMAGNPDAEDPVELAATSKQLRELTRIMETEMHEAVLSCTRARRQMLDRTHTGHLTVH